MLVDSHCHLNYKGLVEELDQVLERAHQNDVRVMVTISTKISEFDNIIKIAEAYDNIYCSVGVHPHEVESEGVVSSEQLIGIASHEKVVGIGETGLDYYYEHSPRELQKESFVTHIQASQETGLPLIVHTRDADQDTIDILQNEYNNKPFPGLIHCFSTGRELALKSIKLGLYISLSGIITFKKSEDLRETVRQLPLEKLLIETDSPFLAPTPHRGKINEPSFVKHVAEQLAEIKNKTFNEISNITSNNFFGLFTKIDNYKYE